jgi:MFS family permease
MSAGSFIGALCAGFIADKWGRRYALMGASIVWVIGAAIQCSTQNVGQLIAGRIISGLSIGITSSQVCVYLAELAPARIRGRIVGIQQWAIEWGILIMFLVAWGCTTVEGPAAFRIAWGVQAVPGFVLFGALIFFPESPRWLAAQERWEECLDVLAAINAKGDRDNPLVQAEYMEVQEAVRIMHESEGVSFLELFGPKIWKRTACGCTVQMWQQLVGGNGEREEHTSSESLGDLC